MVPEHRKMIGLPPDVVGPIDLGRLIREITALDEALLQTQLRQQGTAPTQLPKTSQLMDKAIELNSVNLLDPGDRKVFRQFLEAIKQKAPTMHVSFSSDPSPLFVQKLTNWLREEVNPLTLMTVGLQPGIGAGCVVRTTNKYFDFSLGSHLAKQRDILMKSLRGQLAQPPAPAAVPAVAAQPAVAAAPAAPTKLAPPAVPLAEVKA